MITRRMFAWLFGSGAAVVATGAAAAPMFAKGGLVRGGGGIVGGNEIMMRMENGDTVWCRSPLKTVEIVGGPVYWHQKGGPLTPQEIDNNIRHLEERIERLERLIIMAAGE